MSCPYHYLCCASATINVVPLPPRFRALAISWLKTEGMRNREYAMLNVRRSRRAARPRLDIGAGRASPNTLAQTADDEQREEKTIWQQNNRSALASLAPGA